MKCVYYNRYCIFGWDCDGVEHLEVCSILKKQIIDSIKMMDRKLKFGIKENIEELSIKELINIYAELKKVFDI